jgi:hypothetical protein
VLTRLYDPPLFYVVQQFVKTTGLYYFKITGCRSSFFGQKWLRK